jgi:hypothetical protein
MDECLIETQIDDELIYDYDEEQNDEERFDELIRRSVRFAELIWMPEESLERIGEAAGLFYDNNDGPDGDLLLAPYGICDHGTLSDIFAAGGELIRGYSFWYPQSVADNPDLPSGWCAYHRSGIGYALDYDVAYEVCAASHAAASA